MTNQAYSLPFARVGKDVQIWPLAKIVAPEKISLSNSIIIDDFVLLMGGKQTSLGDFVHIAAFTSVGGGGILTMDDFSGLSGGVRVYTGSDDYSGQWLSNPTIPYEFRHPTRSHVTIKKHAIVGANSVVLAGVTINEGAIIGANSFVKSDCEPWTYYVGCPAQPIKRREKEKLLALEEQLRKEYFDSDNNYIGKHE